MTDPLLALESQRVSVMPGGQARVTVTIRNPGTIVEGYDLTVVSEAPISWVEVIPPLVSVFPQQEETAVIVFTPPSGPHAPGGVLPFGLRAKSQVDASSSAVVEGDLEVNRVFGLQARLVPVTSSGRWRGRHTIQVSNWGNAPARLRLVASDPDEALGFLTTPETIDVPLGATRTARLRVKTRKPTLRGTPQRLPFQVIGEPDPPSPVAGPVSLVSDPGRPILDGAFSQKPILTRGFVTGSIAALALAIAAVVFGLSRLPGVGPLGDGGGGAGFPEKPELKAEANGKHAITLSWKAVPGIDGYKLYDFDPETKVKSNAKTIDSGSTGQPVPALEAGSTYCYVLRASNSAGPSDSEPVCATTADDSGTVRDPYHPTFKKGDWIGVIDLWGVGSIDGKSSAEEAQALLAEAGVTTDVLLADGSYPGLILSGADQPLDATWVLYSGPSDTPVEAFAECDDAASRLSPPRKCYFAKQPAMAPQ